jgi:ketosteroid isomerase-like protein
MTARETIESYIAAVRTRGVWDSWLADDVMFTSLVTPNKVIKGKLGVVQALKRFYSMATELSVNSLVVENDRVIALTRYRLQPPNGLPGFDSDVAEAFVVRDGRIADFRIYFDSAPFPK